MRGNLGRLVTLVRTEGVRETLHRLAFRFFHVHSFAVMRLELSDALPEARIPPGIEVREVRPEELAGLRAGRTDLPEYFYREESGKLDRCWVGVKEGRLGFISWVSYRGSSGFVRLKPGEVEIDYTHCLPDLRGQRLTTNAYLVMAHALFREGRTVAYGVPHAKNLPIIKSFLASGFAQVGLIRRWGLLTWPRTPVEYSGVVLRERPRA